MNGIEKLKNLNLTEYPIAKIDKLLSQIGTIGIMLTDFSIGKEIERAVNNSIEEPEFNKVSRISFKPAKFNNNYLRASTPKNTMFYGSVITEQDLMSEKRKYNRFVTASEVSPLIRNTEIVEGWGKITFGMWKVIEKISVATIIDPTKDYDEVYLNDLKIKYTNFLNKFPLKIKDNTISWLKYLSEEFSKKVSDGYNYDYLISAKFTELFVNKSVYEGVIYPSVQSDGYGLCVAIHPNAISKLKLNKVLQCKLIKKLNADNKNEFLLFDEKFCSVQDGADTFELKEI